MFRDIHGRSECGVISGVDCISNRIYADNLQTSVTGTVTKPRDG